MVSKIKRWGDGVGLFLPKPLAHEAGVEAGTSVQVTFESGRVIVEAIKPTGYRVDDMVEQITEENLPDHEDVSWGPPMGKEHW